MNNLESEILELREEIGDNFRWTIGIDDDVATIIAAIMTQINELISTERYAHRYKQQ